MISSYRDETSTKTKEIEELSDPNNPRVFHVTRCSACGGPPELPTTHFMCKHSKMCYLCSAIMTSQKNVCAERSAGRLLATAKRFGIEWDEGAEVVQEMQREIKEDEETFNMGDFWCVGDDLLEISIALILYAGQGIYLLSSKEPRLRPFMSLIGNLQRRGQVLRSSDSSWERRTFYHTSTQSQKVRIS